MSILRFKRCFKGTGSSLSVVGIPEVDSKVREEPSKGSETPSSLLGFVAGLKYPPITVCCHDMKVTILTQATKKFTNLVQVCSCYYKPHDRNGDHHSIWQQVWVLYPDMARKHFWKMVMRPGKPATN
jgi:hypothetical protein